jgi:nitrogen fixation-related uncharacterized protein
MAVKNRAFFDVIFISFMHFYFMGAFIITVVASAVIAVILGILLIRSIRCGEMDDLDTPALRILTEDLDES